MTTRSTLYTHQSIAAAGFAVMDRQIAWELRPDLWASPQDCALTFKKKQDVQNAHRMIATVEGYGEVLVFARSLDQLDKRLEWVIGRPVRSIQPEQPEAVVLDTRIVMGKQEHERKEAERLEQLEKIATQDLLGHDCAHDREIIAARAELGYLPEAA